MADIFGKKAGGTKTDGLIVLIELAKRHAQAVVGE